MIASSFQDATDPALLSQGDVSAVAELEIFTPLDRR
jgi:hypothetical protein